MSCFPTCFFTTVCIVPEIKFPYFPRFFPMSLSLHLHVGIASSIEILYSGSQFKNTHKDRNLVGYQTSDDLQ